MQRKITFKSLTVLFVATLLLFSCRKHHTIDQENDSLKQQFFKLPGNASDELKQVTSVIREQDSKNNFLNDLIRKNGLPVWEKIVDNSKLLHTPYSTDTLTFFIPFRSLSGSEITSYLVCTKANTAYNFRFYKKHSIENIQATDTSRQQFLQSALGVFAYFEKEINQKDSILIGGIYNRHFSKGKITFQEESQTTSTGRSQFSAYGITICYKISCGGGEEQTVRTNIVFQCYDCNTYWTIDWGGSGGVSNTWWFSDGGGFSGGSTGTNYSSTVQMLINQLGLNTAQADFLNNDPDRANQVLLYLQTSPAPNLNQIAVGHINRMMVDMQYLTFVQVHQQSNSTGTVWWEDYNYLDPFGGINFGDWAINYLNANTQVPFATFKNQFLTPKEGTDGDYDSNFWDDPNLTFPQQNLPTWAAFDAAYPADKTAAEVYELVGGTPKSLRDGVLTDSDPTNDHAFDNACALRVSRALNYSGVTIPYLPGQTYPGGDGKYYFLGAKKLNIWMRKTFGTNPATATTPFNAKNIHITAAQAGTNGAQLPTLLANKKGIYSMVSSNSSWATGHADILYDDTTCDTGCHFDGPIAYIDFWELD